MGRNYFKMFYHVERSSLASAIFLLVYKKGRFLSTLEKRQMTIEICGCSSTS